MDISKEITNIKELFDDLEEKQRIAKERDSANSALRDLLCGNLAYKDNPFLKMISKSEDK